MSRSPLVKYAERGSCLKCPDCGGEDIFVADSRNGLALSEPSISRRRKCRKCGCAWSTTEIPVDAIDRLIEGARVEFVTNLVRAGFLTAADIARAASIVLSESEKG